ncbi:MAG: FecR family protein [Nitrosomonas sp.]|nr:MAG: FecR family protein [Nitrosomonas sp.]
MKYPNQPSPIDTTILKETVEWLVKFQAEEAGEDERLALDRWHDQSPAHIAAWQHIQSILNAFKQIPPEIAHGALDWLDKLVRRKVIRILGLLIMVVPSAWLTKRYLPWQEWTADLRTATGEQKTIHLTDRSCVVLNTASVVDIVFNAEERCLKLHIGEILIYTGHDPLLAYRPFLVQTLQGIVQALGTEFSVRCFDEYTRVTVSQDAVEIRPLHAQPIKLHAGEQIDCRIDSTQSLQSADAMSELWTQGIFIAKNMRLADLVSELNRYCEGFIRCHSNVANTPVSSSFSLTDIDSTLKLLQESLPLRVSSFSRYWITIEEA